MSKLLRYFYGFCVFVMMFVIFFFSSQNADQSSKLSQSVLVFIKQLISPLVDFALGRTATMEEMSFVVRKAAHFSEYALLCLFTRLFLNTFQLRFRSPLSWCLSTLYAATDEFHQLFSVGRSAQLTDVMIDSTGALTGLCAALILLWLHKRLRKHRSPDMSAS